MICPECGSYVSNNLDTCPFCGSPVKEEPAAAGHPIQETGTPKFVIIDETNKAGAATEKAQPEDIYSSSQMEDLPDNDESLPKSSFDPNAYPVIDPTELPAYKVAQKAAQSVREQEQDERQSDIEFFNMEYDDVEEDGFEDEGPEIIGLMQPSSKVVREDKSTFSVGAFFKNTFAGVGAFFGRIFNKKKNDEPRSVPVGLEDEDKKRRLPEFKPGKKQITVICTVVAAFAVLLAAAFGITNLVKGQAKADKLFPAIFYDSGKLVLLESDDAEDKSNIASSGINSAEDVQYFEQAKRVYYIKNNDLYTYSLKNDDGPMRIIRNVSNFACFDTGKEAIACAQDGKVYYFNGKEVSSIAKDNDEAGAMAKFPLVFGQGGKDAVYLDKYDSAASTAELYSIRSSGKTKLIAEIKDSAADIKYTDGGYALVAYAMGNAEIYDLDGKCLLEIDNYSSSVKIGKNGLLISRKDGSLSLFDDGKEIALELDIASVISVSETENSFAYYDSGKVAYLYKKGKAIEICDATFFTSLAVDMDTYQVFALEDDVLTMFYLKSDKYKERELGDGVESIARDERTGHWMAAGFDSAYIVNGDKLDEIYSGTKNMPFVSLDGKKFLVINEDKELVLISGKSEKTIAQNVQAFRSDTKLKNILFVADEKLYCNSTDNKITNLRDVSSFEIISPMD